VNNSLQNKTSVYLRIPKTGSTSLCRKIKPYQEILYNARDKYLGKTRYKCKNLAAATRDVLGDDLFNKMFKFSFVRNPWDRAISSWRYTSFRKRQENFKDFCEDLQYRENCGDFHSWHATEQWIHLYDVNTGKLIVDFIGRFENLQEDFDIVCDKIGIPKQHLPHKNATKHKHYTEYYDDETRQIVAEKYAKDIEYFGYEFGES